jgi:hypothetical protein
MAQHHCSARDIVQHLPPRQKVTTGKEWWVKLRKDVFGFP